MKGKAFFLSVFLIVFLVVSLTFSWSHVDFVPKVKATPGWLSDWDFRIQIDIDSGDVDDSLSSFPVLIFLSNSSSGIYDEDVSCVFDEVGANSQKIAVTVGEDTETFVEIEKWDATNEQAWLWANVTADSASNTTLYLYYDNDHADNTDYVGDKESTPAMVVWDSDFASVWHLDETGSNPQCKDSTSNNEDSTANAADPTISGKIDGGMEFEDSTEDYTALTACQTAEEGTLEAWAKFDLTTNRRPIMVDQGAGYLFLGIKDDTKVRIATYDTASHDAISTTTPTVGVFYHCCGVYKNGEVNRIYINGVDEAQSTVMTGDLGSTATAMKLGYDGIVARTLDGILDEVRIHKVKRSASWIKASYESGKDDLLDFGSEETPGGEDYTADLTQSLSTTWSVLTEWDAIADFSQGLTTSWSILTKWDAILDVTQSLTTSWTILTQWNSIIDLTQALSTTWTVLIQSSFNIVTSLSNTFTWTVDIYHWVFNIAYIADLTLSIITTWIADISLTTLGISDVYALAALGFIFGVIALVLVVNKKD